MILTHLLERQLEKMSADRRRSCILPCVSIVGETCRFVNLGGSVFILATVSFTVFAFIFEIQKSPFLVKETSQPWYSWMLVVTLDNVVIASVDACPPSIPLIARPRVRMMKDVSVACWLLRAPRQLLLSVAPAALSTHVKQLDLFVKVVLLEESPAVLGKLCEDHGCTYHWISGQKAHLIRSGKRVDCNISNYVPFVVPG